MGNRKWEFVVIYSVINHNKARHSCECRNPGKHWIPGQARNDKPVKIYVVMYNFKSSIISYCYLIMDAFFFESFSPKIASPHFLPNKR
jgi:hypothetical protein